DPLMGPGSELTVPDALPVHLTGGLSLLGCLRLTPRGTDQNALQGAIDIEQLDATLGDLVFADLIGVAHPARLQHVETAVALAVGLQRAKRDPSVDQRGNALIPTGNMLLLRSEPGHHGGDALGLQDVDHAQQYAVDLGLYTAKRGDRVDDGGRGFKLVEIPVHPCQVHFKAIEGRSGGLEPQQSRVQVLLKIDSDGSNIANDLPGRFFECEIKAALSARAGRGREMRSKNCLSGPGRAGNENAGAFVIAARSQ